MFRFISSLVNNRLLRVLFTGQPGDQRQSPGAKTTLVENGPSVSTLIV